MSVLPPRFQSWSLVYLKAPDYATDFISDPSEIKIFYGISFKKEQLNKGEIKVICVGSLDSKSQSI